LWKNSANPTIDFVASSSAINTSTYGRLPEQVLAQIGLVEGDAVFQLLVSRQLADELRDRGDIIRTRGSNHARRSYGKPVRRQAVEG
jgi:hypothetical protein